MAVTVQDLQRGWRGSLIIWLCACKTLFLVDRNTGEVKQGRDEEWAFCLGKWKYGDLFPGEIQEEEFWIC